MPSRAALWNILGTLLFVAGVLGAGFVERRMHRAFIQDGGLRRSLGLKDLYRLIVVCPVCALLIGAAMLLPVLVGLGPHKHPVINASPRVVMCVAGLWLFNACWACRSTLRLTRGTQPDRLRYAAVAAIVLTMLMVALHIYFWIIDPAGLTKVFGPRSAAAVLSVLGVACLVSLRMLAADRQVGSVFDWAHIRARAFGWFVLVVNSGVFLVWYIRLSSRFEANQFTTAMPILVFLPVVFCYQRCKDMPSTTDRITKAMIVALAIQLVIVWVLVTPAAQRP
jgi:hypothetical protein